jgi:hypothetical protein
MFVGRPMGGASAISTVALEAMPALADSRCGIAGLSVVDGYLVRVDG